MESLPVAGLQGGADRPLRGVCVQSQKGNIYLWAAPARCDCVRRAQREPGCGHPGEIHPLPQVMGRCRARGLLLWGSQMSCCRGAVLWERGSRASLYPLCHCLEGQRGMRFPKMADFSPSVPSADVCPLAGVGGMGTMSFPSHRGAECCCTCLWQEKPPPLSLHH